MLKQQYKSEAVSCSYAPNGAEGDERKIVQSPAESLPCGGGINLKRLTKHDIYIIYTYHVIADELMLLVAEVAEKLFCPRITQVVVSCFQFLRLILLFGNLTRPKPSTLNLKW